MVFLLYLGSGLAAEDIRFGDSILGSNPQSSFFSSSKSSSFLWKPFQLFRILQYIWLIVGLATFTQQILRRSNITFCFPAGDSDRLNGISSRVAYHLVVENHSNRQHSLETDRDGMIGSLTISPSWETGRKTSHQTPWSLSSRPCLSTCTLYKANEETDKQIDRHRQNHLKTDKRQVMKWCRLSGPWSPTKLRHQAGPSWSRRRSFQDMLRWSSLY